MLRNILIAGVCALMMAGCSVVEFGERLQGFSKHTATAPDPIEQRLTESAYRAVEALETLALIEAARTPLDETALLPDSQNVPYALGQLVTVSWIGPVEPIVRRLAQRADYRFLVLGDSPPVPLTVDLEANSEELIDILRDIGIQMGRRAELVLDARAQRIELRYASVDRR